MGLFDWLFKTGDQVEIKRGEDAGKVGKVKGFPSPGQVDVEIKNSDGSTTVTNRFGGSLKKVG